MKSILKKASELGKEVADTVKGAAEDVKEAMTKDKGFLVEKFPSEDAMASRLNDLQDEFNSVNVQAACTIGDGYLIAIIKLES